MNSRLLALLLGAVAAPASAQHQGHGQPDPHAAHQSPAPATAADPHAGHGDRAQPAPAPAEPSAPTPPPDPHAGHRPPPATAPAAADPHAGHRPPPPAAADPHAGHAAAELPAPPVAPPPPAALAGPAHAADLVHEPAGMAAARERLRRTHGAMRHSLLLVDQFEARLGDGRDLYAWEDVQFRHGGDIDRLWIKSRGEGEYGGALERAELQALWSHAIDPWFDLQAGLRYDVEPDPERAYLVLGVQGLAPYWFEIDAAAFLSGKGDLTARIEAEYDLRITQRLILQPAAELELALQDVPELGTGAGISSAEAGLRLRYEIVPEFAPYVGVQYERALGDSADFARAAGEDVGGWSLLLGTRLWF